MPDRQAHSVSHRRGFSLIELLVVVGVVGLLLASLTVAGSTAIYAARAKNTRQVIANVEFALEIFREENPLRLTYDRPRSETFGPYPPYQLADWTELPFGATPGTVAQVVQPYARDLNATNRLSDRLHADLGEEQGRKRHWVRLGDDRGGKQANEGDGHDDNRALVAYLTAFAPGALTGLPNWASKPINPDPERPDLINPTGTQDDPGTPDSGWVDLLGVHDAWGVPLDYFQYVKLEWTYDRGPDGVYAARYMVRDRRPAIRSFGLDRDTYDVWKASGLQDNTYNKADNWILSSPLPRPFLPETAVNANDGTLSAVSGQLVSGWVRVAAMGEATRQNFTDAPRGDYGYLPSEDPR